MTVGATGRERLNQRKNTRIRKNIKTNFCNVWYGVFQQLTVYFRDWLISLLLPEFKMFTTRPLFLAPPTKLTKPRLLSPFKPVLHSPWSNRATPAHQISVVSLAGVSDGSTRLVGFYELWNPGSSLANVTAFRSTRSPPDVSNWLRQNTQNPTLFNRFSGVLGNVVKWKHRLKGLHLKGQVQDSTK